MIIIVEGADGSGKTTLVNTLKNDYGYEVKIGPGKGMGFGHWVTFLNDVTDCTVILDRSFVTDFVYRIVDGKKGDFKLHHITSLLQAPNMKFVYCDTMSAYDDAMKRGEDNITERREHIRIANAYSTFFEIYERFNSVVNIMKYNWKNDDIKDVIKFINGGNNGTD